VETTGQGSLRTTPVGAVSSTSSYTAAPSSSYTVNQSVNHVANMDTVLNNEQTALDNYWAGTDKGQQANYGWLNEKGGTPTGCGTKTIEDAMGEAAFYCYADHTIYLDISFLNYMDATYGMQGVQAVFAHEYGHHIEADTGEAYTAQTTRQLELHADYYAGQFINWWYAQSNANYNTTVIDQQFLDAGDPAGTAWYAPGAHGTGFERKAAFENGTHGLNWYAGLANIGVAAPARAIA
jgi:predicted metalloprotease